MSKHHDLKTDPLPFHAVRLGRKLAELRLNDRDYQSGDTVTLHEYDRELSSYTGDTCGPFTIGHILRGGYGMPEWFVMFSLLSAPSTREAPRLAEAGHLIRAFAKLDEEGLKDAGLKSWWREWCKISPRVHDYLSRSQPMTGEGCTYVHEDELPEDITDAEYSRWFSRSWLSGGTVGVRVGPPLSVIRAALASAPPEAARGAEPVAWRITYANGEILYYSYIPHGDDGVNECLPLYTAPVPEGVPEGFQDAIDFIKANRHRNVFETSGTMLDGLLTARALFTHDNGNGCQYPHEELNGRECPGCGR